MEMVATSAVSLRAHRSNSFLSNDIKTTRGLFPPSNLTRRRLVMTLDVKQGDNMVELKSSEFSLCISDSVTQPGSIEIFQLDDLKNIRYDSRISIIHRISNYGFQFQTKVGPKYLLISELTKSFLVKREQCAVNVINILIF